MKAIYKLALLSLLLVLAVSCENGNDPAIKTQGFIQFKYAETDRSGGRQQTAGEPFALLISIKRGNTYVVENLKLQLYTFGVGFVSESLQLPTGSYTLTQFMVVDSENHVLYAAPLVGSEQAQYVVQPLPIDFEISEFENTVIVPEVLVVTEDQTPESYGYLTFSFHIVDPSAIPPNTIKFRLDSVMWISENINPATYISELHMLAFAGRRNVSDSTYESFWIIARNYNLTTGIIQIQDTEFQLGLNESVSSGQYLDSDWGFPTVEQLVISEYDSVNRTVSGTFSGYVHDPSTLGKKVITEGIFNKIQLN